MNIVDMMENSNALAKKTLLPQMDVTQRSLKMIADALNGMEWSEHKTDEKKTE
jgi:hypothetical protein